VKLHEYESKNIIHEAGINIPYSILTKTGDEALAAYREIKSPVVIKAQVLSSGRKKAGGVIFVDKEAQVKEVSERLLKSEISGIPVDLLLIQRRIQIKKEFYLGITIDRNLKRAVYISSMEGGIEIEKTALKDPKKIFKDYIDPIKGISNSQIQNIAKKMNLKNRERKEFVEVVKSLYKVFEELDCELLETNPLVLDEDDNFVAIDARIIVDDNAIFRHKELQSRTIIGTNLEIEASRKGLSFVELDGYIGIIGNGAGLVMATMDVVEYYGGKPANFCDLGGGANTTIIKEALRIVLKNPKIKVLIVNILGGITQCVEVANAIVEYIPFMAIKAPIIIRLAGVGEEEAWKILRKAGLYQFSSMEEAVKKAVNIAKEVR
jgi:succinyl-CoA synthetase beta subunit